jgi:hypothetical protein
VTSDLHPKVVLERLLAATHRPERRAALKGIHAICEAQAAGTARDFALGTIGALAEALGLLKKKTLSNKSSAELVSLIAAWQRYAGSDRLPIADPARTVIEEKLLSIPDPAFRTLLQSRLAERDKLVSQVNLLKSATTIVIDRSPHQASAPQPVRPLQLELPYSELSALRQVLSSTFLSDEGWAEGPDGEILVVNNGRRIFPKGFLTLLRRVLEFHVPERR